MEDDDDFGDLYSDVLIPFSDPSAFQSHQPPPRSEPVPPPIDYNPAAAASVSSLRSDDADVIRAASSSDSRSNLDINLNLHPTLNLNRSPSVQTHENSFSPSHVSEDPPLLGTHEFRGVSANSPSGAPHVEATETRVSGNPDFDLSTDVAAANHEGDRILDESAVFEDAEIVDKGDSLGVQVEQEDDGPVIPGISIAQPNDGALNPNGVSQEEANDQGDDWESDSDDDLQIVLNENDHPDIHQYQGPVVMGDNGGKVDDDDDEDEDGEPLVIVSDTDAVHHPPPEEQGWDSGQAPDGEGKETSEFGKTNGGVSLPSKIGYNNSGYHQYHSQFKYVRPGATPLPGGSGGAGQVRPPVAMGAVGGRGRGDWRQAGMKGPLQKGFQSGFWGSNASSRGFGGDFILPSQKTIFDINIDTFEERPWNHPGTDVSDFFNFGLNEDGWKEYCKKLEQLRMESSMKSKAHVLVVGSQLEQEYDPDLPPELAAAAAGIQDPSIENSNAQIADVGQSDIANGTSLMRPPLPTGRPIQVDTGSGERLPSMDIRPPRMRDPDSVIEIVLQGLVEDDSSAGYGAIDQQNNDASREVLRDDAVKEDDEQSGNKNSDGIQQSLDRTKRKDNARRLPRVNASYDDIPRDESSLCREAPIENSAGSRENSPVYPSDTLEASHEERRIESDLHERSHSTSSGESALGGKFVDDKNEESNESMEGKDSLHRLSFEERVVSDDEPDQTEENYQKEKENVNSSVIVSTDSLDTCKHHSSKRLKLGAQVDHMETKETNDMGYTKAARSSDNSRATGSSTDRQEGYNVADEEGMQDEYSSHARDKKRNHRGGVDSHHSKDRDGSLETEKNNMLAKRRDGSYHHRDLDPYLPHSSHVKSVGFDRRRGRDYADGMLHPRDEDPHRIKYRSEDSMKHEHADGMIAKHRGKVGESERSNKDDYIPSRKVLENDNWRGHHEKDAGFRSKEKDDILKSRYENMDDPHSKRRKDDEHARRDHFDKDEIFRAHRDNSSHRKRERDESLDQRKRDDKRRRESTDDHRSIRSKDESWLQRERVEQRHRERDDGYRSKQSYEECLSRREREDGRAPIRSGRNAEDKGRTGHSRKDDYKGYERDGSYKDSGRNSEQLKRKDRVEDASSLQYGYEEKRSRQEKPAVRSDHVVHAPDNQKVHDRRAKENSRKSMQLRGGQQRTSNSSKKSQEERSDRNEMAGSKGTTELRNAEFGVSEQLQDTREKMEDASDDDEQHRSKRGRSKMERWTSHEERDCSVNNKPSSSLKVGAEKDHSPGAGHSAKVSDDPKPQAVDISDSASEGKESGVPKEKEPDTKQSEMDTVAKLKKRSERFKLPMAVEKDTATIKKMESEPLPSAPSEAPTNSLMKPERPPRKRRWISN